MFFAQLKCERLAAQTGARLFQKITRVLGGAQQGFDAPALGRVRHASPVEISDAMHLSARTNGVAQVSMGCLAGRLYYTVDGTDPRARGGVLSASAIAYRDPVEVTNQTVTARARSQFGLWSAPVTVR